MEYAPKQDLWELYFNPQINNSQQASNGVVLLKNKPKDHTQVANIIWQVCEAVSFLHKCKIIHGDLKLENVLIKQNGKIALCDFGMSLTFEDANKKKDIAGTIGYLSPEYFDKEIPNVSTKIDTWAIGVMLYELVYHESPYLTTDDTGTLDINNMYNIILQKRKECINNVHDKCLKDLFIKIFRVDSYYRFSPSQVQKHEWILSSINTKTPKKRRPTTTFII